MFLKNYFKDPSLKELSTQQSNIYMFSNSSDDNAEILAASLSKLYWAGFALILSSRILVSSANVIF